MRDEKPPCPHVFVSGPREGSRCGRRGNYRGYCGEHAYQHEPRPDNLGAALDLLELHATAWRERTNPPHERTLELLHRLRPVEWPKEET